MTDRPLGIPEGSLIPVLGLGKRLEAVGTLASESRLGNDGLHGPHGLVFFVGGFGACQLLYTGAGTASPCRVRHAPNGAGTATAKHKVLPACVQHTPMSYQTYIRYIQIKTQILGLYCVTLLLCSMLHSHAGMKRIQKQKTVMESKFAP